MRLVAVSAAVALFLVVLSARGFAAQGPIPISDCENITHPGNYALTNNLILDASEQGYGEGGNCLVVSSSHVSIDLGGWTISVACAPFSFCPPDDGVVGGIAIEILEGADHASISHGSVDGFVYGIVGEADHISASNLNLVSVVGITLTNVSQSAFKNITFEGADTSYHGSNGPILYLEGGGENVFGNLSGEIGSDLGGPDGIDVVSSNANLISGVNLDNTSCGGTDIRISNSSAFNLIANNTLFDECGGGIEVDLGSRYNAILGNAVTIASPSDVFALLDQNPNCRSDIWIDNNFSNIFQPGQVSASPANCVR